MIESITKLIQALPEYEPKMFRPIFGGLIKYIFKEISADEFQRVLKTVGKLPFSDARDWRTSVTSDAYVVRDFKAFIYSLVCKPVIEMNLAARAKLWNIHPTDRNNAYKAINALRLEGYFKRVRDEMASPEARLMLNTHATEEKLARILPDLKERAQRFVMKKLRFVCNSTNTEPHDLVVELLCKAIGRYYWMTPTDRSELHITNSLRTAVNNFGQNLINYHTAKKRSRLVQSGSGFSLLVMSQNQIHSDVAYHELGSDFTSNLKSTETLLTVKKVIESVSAEAHSRKKMKFLLLLTGEYDEDFSQWLRSAGYNDNDELYDNNPFDVYLELVAEHLKVSKKVAQDYLDRLNRKFG